MQRVEDIECNRCHGLYSNMERGTLSILYNNCYLSICPKCTKEVAALMGFDDKELLSKMGQIKRAETENNRKYALEHGELCSKCEKKFSHNEARVRDSIASNVRSWHLECYEQ